MKQWEQIAFTVALAAFGWLLFAETGRIKQNKVNTAQYGGQVAPLFMSLNQIDLGSYFPFTAAANNVPLDDPSAGQAYSNGFTPLDNYVPF